MKDSLFNISMKRMNFLKRLNDGTHTKLYLSATFKIYRLILIDIAIDPIIVGKNWIKIITVTFLYFNVSQIWMILFALVRVYLTCLLITMRLFISICDMYTKTTVIKHNILRPTARVAK